MCDLDFSKYGMPIIGQDDATHRIKEHFEHRLGAQARSDDVCDTDLVSWRGTPERDLEAYVFAAVIFDIWAFRPTCLSPFCKFITMTGACMMGRCSGPWPSHKSWAKTGCDVQIERENESQVGNPADSRRFRRAVETGGSFLLNRDVSPPRSLRGLSSRNFEAAWELFWTLTARSRAKYQSPKRNGQIRGFLSECRRVCPCFCTSGLFLSC